LKKLRENQNSNREFNFDILMANPPFAGDIKESRILAKYDLARSVSLEKIMEKVPFLNVTKDIPSFPEFLRVSGEEVYQMSDGTYRKAKIKAQNTVGRDILFIERNLDFLKPGGRMAIVLPQGRFNNSSDKYIREYIADRCRILAVVGLHGNVFKPHTGTKTSVLLVQKWDETLCPRREDYPIFFATMQEPSKDNSGDKIYIRKGDIRKYKLTPQYEQTEMNMVCEPHVEYITNLQNLDDYAFDMHQHLIVKHDLFNHDGLTQDGIAEAFAEFAKKERLSFF
jgi:type I restriction enzyme M protein